MIQFIFSERRNASMFEVESRRRTFAIVRVRYLSLECDSADANSAEGGREGGGGINPCRMLFLVA